MKYFTRRVIVNRNRKRGLDGFGSDHINRYVACYESFMKSCIDGLMALESEVRYWRSNQRRLFWFAAQNHVRILVTSDNWLEYTENLVVDRILKLDILGKSLSLLLGELHRRITKTLMKLEHHPRKEEFSDSKEDIAYYDSCFEPDLILRIIECAKESDSEKLSDLAKSPDGTATPIAQSSNAESEEDSRLFKLESFVKTNDRRITEFVLKTSSAPNFFQRNWLSLSLAAATGLAAGAIAYRHSYQSADGFQNWLLGLGEGVQNFFKTRINEPVTNIYKGLTESPIAESQAAEKTVQDARDSLTSMVIDFVQSRSSDPEIIEKARLGDMAIVMKTIEEQMTHPFRNLLAGYLTQAIIIQVQNLMVRVEEEMNSVKRLVRANEINLWISSLAPAGLIMFLVGWVFTRGDYALEKERAIDKMGSTMRGAYALHDLDSLLSMFDGVPVDLPESEWLCYNGIILVNVAILEKGLKAYQRRRRRSPNDAELLLFSDLEQLAVYDDGIAKKLRVLNRMRCSFKAVQAMTC